MSGRLRLGLLGAGRWGRVYIRTIASLPDLALARVASRNPATPGLVPPGCLVSADWREVLAADGLDAVIVASPPALHAEMSAAAVEAGLPVLVEKPLTLQLEQARGLLEQARRKKILVMVEHTYLFHPAYEKLKELSRQLGQVRAVQTESGGPGPFRPDVGPLWDYGAHDVALCLDLLGAKPESVSASRERRIGRAEDVRVTLGFAGGIEARLHVGTLFDKKIRSAAVDCERGRLAIDFIGEPALVLDGRALSVDPTPPLERALRAFAAAVRAGEKEHPSLALGVDVVETLAACQRSLSPVPDP